VGEKPRLLWIGRRMIFELVQPPRVGDADRGITEQRVVDDFTR
jgi:hypothetical protein